MNSLFNHAVKQSQQVKKDLEKVAATPEDAPLSLHGQISATLTSFQRTLDSYEAAVAKEVNAEKKQTGTERLAKFRQELADARVQLRELRERRQDAQESNNRQELFARRTNTSSQASENPYAAPVSGPNDVTREQGLAREGDVLSFASQQLDDFIERGRQALGDIGDQNELLRSTQQTLRKAAGTLGISTETIRKVEKRAREDKYFFYGGIVVLLVLFWLIVRWLRQFVSILL